MLIFYTIFIMIIFIIYIRANACKCTNENNYIICNKCGVDVDENYNYCPNCKEQIKKKCNNCEMLIHTN
ncbi:MAG: hypothetical protein ACTHVS_03690, partial [Senegalia sp. (in: firmicutes)]